ncbi:hypothetical protein O181_118106 [Austropuccinia psidii MF-1]|uniref:Uncharacterized protein n=1 Tax=Austropuccinia psidii MF-1 TaxID=1389203 RepID=A0A9Q3PYI8_9BASI|nr:hypothetical protein [Austropuccinia psidii MF-1]
MLSEDQKKKLAQGKEKSPRELLKPQQAPKKDNPAPNRKRKGRGKAKSKWNKPYLQNSRIPKREKTAMDNVFNMGSTLMEFKNKDEERMYQSFSKK